MITNNGESTETRKKQPGQVIPVSTSVWNYLDKQKRFLKNEHEDNINKLIRDSKEYRIAVPDAPYPNPKKWDTKTVRISDELYSTLNILRGKGIIRTGESEYSYARILNDLLSDSESLAEIEKKAMSELEA